MTLLLLLVVGPSSASASSVLCKTNSALCSEKSIYPTGTEFSYALATGTRAVIDTAFNRTECGKSALTAKTEKTNEEGHLVGKLTALSFGECTLEAEGKCTKMEVAHLPWKMEFVAGGNSTENAIYLSDGGNGKPTLICNGCPYASSQIKLETRLENEGERETLVVNNEVLERTNLLCSEKLLSWGALYEPLSPSPVFLTNS